jgi:hypothetical protein
MALAADNRRTMYPPIDALERAKASPLAVGALKQKWQGQEENGKPHPRQMRGVSHANVSVSMSDAPLFLPLNAFSAEKLFVLHPALLPDRSPPRINETISLAHQWNNRMVW